LPYFLGNPEQEKELYIKYVPYLTIQKEADVSESPEYLRIKQENQILQAETARHVVERSELQDLRKELEQTKSEKQEDAIKFEDLKLEMKDEMENKFNELLRSHIRLKNAYNRQRPHIGYNLNNEEVIGD
jgi:hypothetical protein